MSWKDILGMVWDMVNSGAGITLIAAILFYLLNKLWVKKPKWKAIYEEYEGALISAVKGAEKLAEGAGKEKLEKALELVVEVLERNVGRKATEEEKVALTIALGKTHDKLEESGVIKNPSKAPDVGVAPPLTELEG